LLLVVHACATIPFGGRISCGSVAASNRLQLRSPLREPRGFDFPGVRKGLAQLSAFSGDRQFWDVFSATEARAGRYTFLNEVDEKLYLFVVQLRS